MLQLTHNETKKKQIKLNFKFSFRVNVIGEHVDYCGYPVLPMAIEQTILVAVAPSDDNLVHLKNIDPKYKPFKCNVNTFT